MVLDLIGVLYVKIVELHSLNLLVYGDSVSVEDFFSGFIDVLVCPHSDSGGGFFIN